MAVFTIVLAVSVSCGGASGTRLPSQLARFPADLSHNEVDASGIYPDGWLAGAASANVQQPAGDSALSLRGSVPRIDNPAFQTEVRLLVDGEEIARQPVGLGDFQLSARVRTQAGKRRVAVAFSAAQTLPGGDGRAVGAQLKFLGFEPASAAGAPPADIVQDPRLQLGSGWGPLETFRGETFRWVENDAQVLLAPEPTGNRELSLTAAAGPGVEGKCVLQLLDRSGRQVASATIGGKQAVKWRVPVETGKPNEFRLHVDGGGKRTAADPRILNFRVFGMELTPLQPR